MAFDGRFEIFGMDLQAGSGAEAVVAGREISTGPDGAIAFRSTVEHLRHPGVHGAQADHQPGGYPRRANSRSSTMGGFSALRMVERRAAAGHLPRHDQYDIVLFNGLKGQR